MAMRNSTYVYIQPQSNRDIEVVHCGMGECEPGHSYGPAVRGNYLIHYVVSGKGAFDDGFTGYPLEKGDGFLICPDRLTAYTADRQEPWTYIWVGFTGEKAGAILKKTGLSEQNPVFHDERCAEYFMGMIGGRDEESKTDAEANALRILGELYLLFAHLTKKSCAQQQDDQSFSDKVADFIRSNIHSGISVSRLASDFGYNRSYFCERFKKEKGVSPQRYLIEYRMQTAVFLLKTTNLKVSDIARSVGYEDALLFSRLFKAKTGLSPSRIRE